MRFFMFEKYHREFTPYEYNPYNSTHIQAILDLLNQGFDADTPLCTVIKELNSNAKDCEKSKSASIISELDARWSSHMYPDKSLVFAKSFFVDEFWLSLSSSEQKVFYFMYRHMSPRCLVSFNRACGTLFCGLSDSAFKSAIKGLKDKFGIVVFQTPDLSPSNYTVYMVNPCIVDIGKSLISDIDLFRYLCFLRSKGDIRDPFSSDFWDLNNNDKYLCFSETFNFSFGVGAFDGRPSLFTTSSVRNKVRSPIIGCPAFNVVNVDTSNFDSKDFN